MKRNKTYTEKIKDRRTREYKEWIVGCANAAANNQFFALNRLEKENKELKEKLKDLMR